MRNDPPTTILPRMVIWISPIIVGNGALRSLEPLGMGWHGPKVGSYVRNQFQYTAHLLLGLRVGKQVMITPEDFQRQGCIITCHLQTKNCFEYTGLCLSII